MIEEGFVSTNDGVSELSVPFGVLLAFFRSQAFLKCSVKEHVLDEKRIALC
jgi:hypothetical protein